MRYVLVCAVMSLVACGSPAPVRETTEKTVVLPRPTPVVGAHPCVSCGSEVPAGAKYCLGCGLRQ